MPAMNIKYQISNIKITNQKSKVISNKKIKDNYFEIIIAA